FYVCMCLGFLGMYQGQPEQVRRFVEQIYPRISPWVDRDPRTKISEEAYQHTDNRVLTEPPSNKIILVALVFVFLSVSALAVFYALYAGAVHDLKEAVQVIGKGGS
ncbi:MAG: DotU family type IV/VI secretion system protein, partial [Limisphaerales bacterium]